MDWINMRYSEDTLPIDARMASLERARDAPGRPSRRADSAAFEAIGSFTAQRGKS
jgi:hypothetical protein